jgi:cyclophilin family peptidyl-prolyl cis-trans isomerase
MLKRTTLFTSLFALLFSGNISAQFTGKPQYQILTTRAGNPLGTINIELYPLIAPKHVKNFDSLVSTVFFDTTAFHRVIPGFMIQGGDPNSRHGPKNTWGYGDPSQPTVNAEFSILSHQRGILSAARDANINSANSQFFICVAPSTWLDGQYSIYGHVISGMDVVDTIVKSPRDVNDCPNQKIEMFITYTGSNDTVPNAPVLDLPVSGTQNVGFTKNLKWFSQYGSVMYHVQVSKDSLFSTIFKEKYVVYPNWTVTQLHDTTTYYWRVRSNNGGHWSATHSEVWTFSTNAYASVDYLSFSENGYRLDQNVPNPASGKTLIRYMVPSKEKISIKLFDVTGKELAVLVNEEKAKGEYELALDTDKYSGGIYFYQMQAGSVSSTKKLIVGK